MPSSWDHHLPPEYRARAVEPVRFEHHADASAGSTKMVGYCSEGRRCFYCHEFVLSEERFDEDELPYLIDLYRERVLAWRLTDGTWLKLATSADRLDECAKRVASSQLEIGDESGLR